MKRIVLLLTALWFQGLAASAGPGPILHLVYLTNRDRPPPADYKGRLHRIMVDVQDFYRSEMERNGYGPKTFKLDPGDDGNAVVHLVTLDWDFDVERKFAIRELRPVIADNLAGKGIDIAQEHIVVFENVYWQDGQTWRYDMVYTGIGDPVNGATWVADHEWLDPAKIDPGLKERINDRGQKLSIGQFNVKMIGGVAHEFGHALGLPHNRETEEEFSLYGKALMGAGNYTYRKERLGKEPHGSFLTAAHAFIISLHPLFTGKIPESFARPEVFPEELSFTDRNGQLVVAGRIAPADHVVGVVLYHDPLPTGTNKDYDAFSYLAEMRPDGTFSAALPIIEDKDCALHMTVYFKNGMHRKFSFTQRADDGLESLRMGYVHEQAKHAFLQKDVERLRALAADVESAKLFLRIAEQWQGFRVPAHVVDSEQKVFLSSTRWDAATVGWYVPSFNGVLDPDGRWFRPLESKQGKCPDGLFAHAPSRYAYTIGGKWEKLCTRIGIQRGRAEGSVIFGIKGDGEELYRSSLIRLADGDVSVEVDLSGIRELELVTEPGPDGKDADWGLWIAPVLTR